MHRAPTSRYVLGLSFGFHDSAAALLDDGKVAFGIEEERLSRVKHDRSFPKRAVEQCLAFAGIGIEDVSAVVYYEMPLKKFERILINCLKDPVRGRRYLLDSVNAWRQQRSFDMAGLIADELGCSRDRVRFVGHHQAHAASAFLCSPFAEAAVVTLDGVGEHETMTVSHAGNGALRQIASVRFPHSLGLFYSALTAYLGFEVNEGEYKVMGMAGYGRPLYAEKLRGLFDLRSDGTFHLDQRHFDFSFGTEVPFHPSFPDWLGGPPRPPKAALAVSGLRQDGVDPAAPGTDQFYADIAASLQRCTEEVILHVARSALERAGSRNLCLAGGVALNSLANQRLLKELGCALYVQPAAGDAGGALGAALLGWQEKNAGRPHQPLTRLSLGCGYSDEEIAAICRNAFGRGYDVTVMDDPATLLEAVARLLHEGKVIGWFQGRTEWGPRALGHRSILASPLLPDMQLIVNEKIKFREPFRPFAPAVLAEHAAEYFDVVPCAAQPGSALYDAMLAVARVLEGKKAALPAITHVDGTARVQTVHRDVNPRFYDLIAAFGRLSSVPVLLNTSFNLKGEPMVNSPHDAIATFQACDMDALALGNTLVVKRK